MRINDCLLYQHDIILGFDSLVVFRINLILYKVYKFLERRYLVMNMQGIKSFAHGLKKWTVKNSPVILAGLGVAGLIATAVATAKATVKASKIVEDVKSYRLETGTRDEDENIEGLIKVPDNKEKTYGHYRLPVKEMFALTWKCYIPAAIIGAGSIACIIGGTVQGQKRLAALSALYSMSEQALKEYREATKEVVGEKNTEKISDKIAEDKLKMHKCPDDLVLNTGQGITLFFDSWTGRYFRSNIDFVKRLVNDYNSAIIHGDTVSLNEWYGSLSLPQVSSAAGDEIGWDYDALIDIAYHSKLNENDEPCVVLDFTERPRMLYV